MAVKLVLNNMKRHKVPMDSQSHTYKVFNHNNDWTRLVQPSNSLRAAISFSPGACSPWRTCQSAPSQSQGGPRHPRQVWNRSPSVIQSGHGKSWMYKHQYILCGFSMIFPWIIRISQLYLQKTLRFRKSKKKPRNTDPQPLWSSFFETFFDTSSNRMQIHKVNILPWKK